MTLVQWLIALVINSGMAVYAILVSRGNHRRFGWCLASESVPWWIIGFGTHDRHIVMSSSFENLMNSGSHTSPNDGSGFRLPGSF